MKLKNMRHEAFCHEYSKDLNATRAYKIIYPTVNSDTARANGSKLLANTNVRKRVVELSDKLNKKTDNDSERVIKEIQKLAYQKVSDLVEFNGEEAYIKPFSECSEAALACIESIETTHRAEGDTAKLITKIKFHNKTKALEMLARHHGKFNDKLNINVKSIEQLIKEAKEG